jgi:hypothetical protein
MSNLLTPAEAANTLRTDADDPAMLDLLDGVDEYITHATGKDWTTDETIHPTAKSAARMLLVLWYDNPSGFLPGSAVELPPGLNALLSQLEAKALANG